MPNGASSPVANSVGRPGRAPDAAAGQTKIRPPPVSARKTSPFGAVRSVRGALSPLAHWVTAKPGGAFGSVPAGRAPGPHVLGRIDRYRTGQRHQHQTGSPPHVIILLSSLGRHSVAPLAYIA